MAGGEPPAPRPPPPPARAYRRVWTAQGAPLLVFCERLAGALQAALEERLPGRVRVALGMRYGKPSIRAALEALRAAGARRVLLLPLYPQYCAATSGSTFDAVAEVLKGWRAVPSLRTVMDYHDEPGYIAALAQSVRAFWQAHGRAERLLMSFHGLPTEEARAGDPYSEQCRRTAHLLAEALGLREGEWFVAFQSRFGPQGWLTPYTEELLAGLPRQGVRSVEVICPGFAADCLETLEEIALRGRETFLAAGGQGFSYIPALNDQPEHCAALMGLLMRHLSGWLEG